MRRCCSALLVGLLYLAAAEATPAGSEPAPPPAGPDTADPAWFATAGLEEIAFDTLETSTLAGVGVHRLGRDPAAGPPDGRLFTFLAT